MTINRRFLPLKAHYFFFLGAMSPILPFVMVIVKQLGIPVVVQGTITFFVLSMTILVKPLFGLLVDAFPHARKGVFVLVLAATYICLTSITVLPSMNSQLDSVITGSFDESHEVDSNLPLDEISMDFRSSIPDSNCYVSEGWDCLISCGNASTIHVSHLMIKPEDLEVNHQLENITDKILLYNAKLYTNQDTCFLEGEVRVTCDGANFDGGDCPSLFSEGIFWGYLILFSIGSLGFTVSNSISDAICMDSVGAGGDFGRQRTWGTVGWGLTGPVGGFLVDWWSRGSYGKDYSPILIFVGILGLIDILIAIGLLKVPKIEKNPNVLKEVRKLVMEPHFLMFLFFVVLNGSFDGIVIHYVFVLQEEMAKDTIYMEYIKLIQGCTLFVQCAVEAPFMFVCAWFVKKLGAAGVTKLVFFLYILRLFGLALVGSYGPVWATLITEVLNGPCYGLGYTAIVVQAGFMTPPGTSASVQSIVNICYESLGYALCSLFGGIIKNYWGSPSIYYVFGGVSIVTFILYLIADRWLSEIRRKYSPALQNDPDLKEGTPSEKVLTTPDGFPIPVGLMETKDEDLA